VGLVLPIFCALVTGVGFTWGGIRDMIALFGRLSREKANLLDDGTVIKQRNLDELATDK
jgi:SSS family solute:Na+ symporter